MAPSEPHKDSAILWMRVLSVPVPAGEVDQHGPPTGSAGAVSTEESHRGIARCSLPGDLVPAPAGAQAGSRALEPWAMPCSGERGEEKKGVLCSLQHLDLVRAGFATPHVVDEAE